MREVQDVKRLLYPLIKRLPWVILVFVVGVVFTIRMTIYQVPVYEAKAVIKLDDHSQGFSNNNLYKDLDIFTETNEVLTEVQMIKSEVILKRALSLMPTMVEYHRVGKIRTSEMYLDAPFQVKYDDSLFNYYDKKIQVSVLNNQMFLLVYEQDTIEARFNTSFKFVDGFMSLDLSKDWVINHNEQDLVGDYSFLVNTKQRLLGVFVNEHLFVKEIDKNIGVVTIHFEGEHPQRVADFTNAVAEAYLQDHIETKTSAANLTQNFLNDRLLETKRLLNDSEHKLEIYRLKNRILNVRQETETDLRKLSQLEIQLINLNMKKVVLDSLEKYIVKDRTSFLLLAPSYEAYGGLLFTELVKKLKSLESDKVDLMNRFTADSEEAKTMDVKISNVINYIVENIKSHSRNTDYKLAKIQADIIEEEKKMDDIPTVEKNMLRLERDFQHNQDLFNFLKKKQMEAGIAKSAVLNFHRIIKNAHTPNKPSRPNKLFNAALAGFLCLLFSIFFVYLLEAVRSKINSKYQIESLTNVPVVGVVKQEAHLYNDGSLDFMLTNLRSILNKKKGVKISFNSSIPEEGKTYLSHYAATSLARANRKVLLLDFNTKKPQWHKLASNRPKVSLENYFLDNEITKDTIVHTPINNLSIGGFEVTTNVGRLLLMEDFGSKLEALTTGYDVVIFDCPAYSVAADAGVFMGYSNYKLFIVRHDFTSTKYVKNIRQIVKCYGEEEIGLILNDVPRGVNYSGDFYGSRYRYNNSKGIVNRLIHYWETYKNAWNV